MDFNNNIDNEKEVTIEDREDKTRQVLRTIINYETRVANAIYRMKKFVKHATVIQVLLNFSCLVFILLLLQAYNSDQTEASSGQLMFLIKIACFTFLGSIVFWMAWCLLVIPRNIAKKRRAIQKEMQPAFQNVRKLERFEKIQRN